MKMKRLFQWLSLSALLACAGCQSPPAPEPSAQKPFDEHVSGKTLLNDALVRAQTESKRVLLLFGANWCPYCKALNDLMASDVTVREIVEKSYVVVRIDVGSSDGNRNTALIDRYEAPVFRDGIPALVITDAKGNRLAPNRDNPWTLKDSTGTDRVIAFLKQGQSQ